jgi:ferrous iron transport protein A
MLTAPTTDVFSQAHLQPRTGEMRLADLPPGTCARVVCVSAGDASGQAELGRRLAELGFLPGEAIRIIAKGLMARAPIAVRIGTGTFALRLFEAACIRVRPEQPQPG